MVPDITADEPGNNVVPGRMRYVTGPVCEGPALDGVGVTGNDVSGKSNVATVIDEVVPPVTAALTLSCANCVFGDTIPVPEVIAE